MNNEWEYDINNACNRRHRDTEPFIHWSSLSEFFIYYGEHKEHLRYGQAFCNHFDIHDDELYYCNDTAKAGQLTHVYMLDLKKPGV